MMADGSTGIRRRLTQHRPSPPPDTPCFRGAAPTSHQCTCGADVADVCRALCLCFDVCHGIAFANFRRPSPQDFQYLDLTAGDKLVFKERADQLGWAYGRRKHDHVTGWFPAAYCRPEECLSPFHVESITTTGGTVATESSEPQLSLRRRQAASLFGRRAGAEVSVAGTWEVLGRDREAA